VDKLNQPQEQEERLLLAHISCLGEFAEGKLMKD